MAHYDCQAHKTTFLSRNLFLAEFNFLRKKDGEKRKELQNLMV